ncbi:MULTISPECIES: hypothetical protein [Pectobacterium]|uniref:hypothetical protein n=1 Tax=Pectobacterium TaxID=122277 RepID=UPI003019023F
MSQKETHLDHYFTATKYGYVEGDNGLAFIGFGFDEPVTITNADRFFVGLALDEIEELAVILQDHVNRNRGK